MVPVVQNGVPGHNPIPASKSSTGNKDWHYYHIENTNFICLYREYKFYLAFENSNCKDYITEKFFVNGLNHDVIPIVMGARPEDYAIAAPSKSYIHVDDFDSPKELADYLHKLDQDDQLYNEYFKWKGTGEFINTKFFCRVCSMLHDPKVQMEHHTYEDVNDWWRGKGTCINGSWRKFYKAVAASQAKKTAKINGDSSSEKLAENISVSAEPSKNPKSEEEETKPASLP